MNLSTSRYLLVSSAVVLLSALGWLGFTALKRELIVGKVLIVQANAVANKMALIQVCAIEKSEAERWRYRVAQDCRFLLDQIEAETSECSRQLAATRETYDTTIARLEGAHARAEEAMELARRVWMVNRQDEQAKRRFFALATEGSFPRGAEIGNHGVSSNWQQACTALKDHVVPSLQDELAEVRKTKETRMADIQKGSDARVAEHRDNLSRMLSPGSLNTIPSYVQVAARDITDDSGEFKHKAPRGDYYVIANGSRQVFNDVERYHWAQPVSTSTQEAEKLLLGNMNQIEVGDNNLWRGLRDEIRTSKVSK
jgi:hypothetical protein